MLELYNNIPTLLKLSHNWVVWGIPGALLKSPFNPSSILSNRPLPAKAGIRETWDSYQNAVECVSKGLARGIGYEFDNISITGIDLDHVIDSSGNLVARAREIVDKLNSYTEISPSGTGLHIFVFAPGAKIVRHRKKDFFLEIYNTGRYFTVTGNIYGDTQKVNVRTTELQAVHDELLMPDPVESVYARQPFYDGNMRSRTNTGQERFLRIGLERDKVFEALWDGARRSGDESADDQALMNKLAYWCNADVDAMIRAFMSSPHYLQKDEAHINKCQRPDYLPNTAKKACDTVFSTAIVDYERWQSKRHEKSMTR